MYKDEESCRQKLTHQWMIFCRKSTPWYKIEPTRKRRQKLFPLSFSLILQLTSIPWFGLRILYFILGKACCCKSNKFGHNSYPV
jgi:hypothetical protein